MINTIIIGLFQAFIDVAFIAVPFLIGMKIYCKKEGKDFMHEVFADDE